VSTGDGVKRNGLLPSDLDPNCQQMDQLEAQTITMKDPGSSSSSSSNLSSGSTSVRREFVWTGITEVDEELSLGTISQQFKTAIMRHELTSECVIRQITLSPDREFSIHHPKCTSYRREEVILGPTVEDSAILTSLFPSIDEVCFVCREKVRPLPLALFELAPTGNVAKSLSPSEKPEVFLRSYQGRTFDEFDLDTEEVQKYSQAPQIGALTSTLNALKHPRPSLRANNPEQGIRTRTLTGISDVMSTTSSDSSSYYTVFSTTPSSMNYYSAQSSGSLDGDSVCITHKRTGK
jgi:hypothetical protein